MKIKNLCMLIVSLVLLGLLLGGCKSSAFKEAECQFQAPEGIDIECGYLSVPENRSIENSPMIKLHVAIYHTDNQNPAPDPVVYLDGGPGGFTLDLLSNYLMVFSKLRETRDLILFDQRGVGYSQPSLDCPEVEDQSHLDWTLNLSMKTADQNYTQALQACHDRLTREGIDLSAYTSAANAADVEDLRKALGYKQWNIYGSSYGTRLALTVIRDYPDGVRSVVLDSVFPPQVDLFNSVSTNFERSLNLVFDRCAAEAACNQAFPDSKERFYQFVDQLDSNPQTFTNLYDSSTKKFIDIPMNGDRFIWATFNMLYRTDQIPVLPMRFASLQQGTSASFPQLLWSFITSDKMLSEGMYFSVHCNEEIPFTSVDAFERSTSKVTPRLEDGIDNIQIFQMCSVWGSASPNSIENQAVVSEIPTLILSGEFDPITPPAWGQLAAETLSNSQYLEFPGFGHGILGNGTDGGACPNQVVNAFINNPNAAVDASCIGSYELNFMIP
jgi:pimeloyl-ACP methyl ester carboxylesterase